MSGVYKNFAEFFFLVIVLLGIVIALLAPSAAVSYLVIFISGIFAGRIIYSRKNKMQFPYLMIIVGFLIGYIAGAYYGNRKVLVILFIIGAMVGYKLFDKKILKDTKY